MKTLLVIFIILCLALIVIASIFIFSNLDKRWTIENLDRDLIDCENKYLNEKQGRYNDSLKTCPITMPLGELIEPSFDQNLYQIDYQPYQPAPTTTKERKCLDWVNLGEGDECIKWSE